MAEMITVTDGAASKIVGLMAEENKTSGGLGCSCRAAAVPVSSMG